jgi:hypothetical protein
MKEVTSLGAKAQWDDKVPRPAPEGHTCLSAFAPWQDCRGFRHPHGRVARTQFKDMYEY